MILRLLCSRFLIIFPTLGLLILILLLVLNNTPGIRQMQEQNVFDRYVDPLAAEAAFQSFQQRNSLDLPVFYYSILPAIFPDTLRYLSSHPDFTAFKKLAVLYHDRQKTKEVLDVLLALKLNEGKKAYIAAMQALEAERVNSAKAYDNAVISTANIRWQHFLPRFIWHGSHNQFHVFCSNLFQGTLGQSYFSGKPVSRLLAPALKNSVWLGAMALLISWLLAIMLAGWLWVNKSQRAIRLANALAYTGQAIPGFLLALLLMIIFADQRFLGWFPIITIGYDITFSSLVLPCLALVGIVFPYAFLQSFRAFQELGEEDYIKTARAKGLSEWQIWYHHALKNAFPPLLTIITGALPAMVSGAIVVEIIFSLPGTGRLLADAIMMRDYAIVLAITLVIGTFTLVVNVLADVGYRLLDPRVQYG